MKNGDAAAHEMRIVEQFNAQANAFGKVPAHLAGIDNLIKLCGIGWDDTVIDVACGPGLLACEFARHARRVVGSDIASAMLEKAAERAVEMRLENLSWVRSDAYALPFPDGSFDIVATRYSMHHMLEPARLMKELLRLCRRGGRVIVADVCIEESCVGAYDRLELIRDDSHVHALSPREFEGIFEAKSFTELRRAFFPIDIELDAQIKASHFKSEEDVAKFRQLVTGDLGRGELGVAVHMMDGKLFYSCPILALCGVKS